MGVIGVQYRHAIDGTAGITTGHGVDDVVSSDDQRNIRGIEFRIDLIEIKDQVVGDTGFGEKHVHMPGHAARDGMDCKFYFNPAFLQQLAQFPDLMLRLCNGHAIAGYDNHFLAKRHHNADIVGFDGFHGAAEFGAAALVCFAKAAEQDIGQ